MTFLDWIILAVIALYGISGLRQGLFVTLGSFLGFLVGAGVAIYASPWVVSQVSSQWYLLAGLGTVIACLILGQSLGLALGSSLRRVSDRTPLRGLERLAGAALSMLLSALVILTIVLVVRPLGIPAVTNLTSQSKVISWMMAQTPEAAQDQVNQIRSQLLEASGLPEISQLLYPVAEAPSQPLANPALEAASQSVVQIVGAAQACNYRSEGSGFVTSGGLVVTNAHVVAGVTSPSVLARDGQSTTSRVVYFDAEKDIAILSAPSLTLTPLTVDPAEVPAGSTVAFMGYPGGGPFQSRAASVQGLGYTQTVDASSGQTNPSRLVYQLAAQVEQGNSGGPVLTEDGSVVAMIFAKATEGQTGYAVPSSEISQALAQVSSASASLATGSCSA